MIERLFLDGGIINVDLFDDFDKVIKVVMENLNKKINIGIRLNYDVGDKVLLRFGFDIGGNDFEKLFNLVS